MHKGYAGIAYSIGKGIQNRTCVENNRLSDRLRDLLERLSDKEAARTELHPRQLITKSPPSGRG